MTDPAHIPGLGLTEAVELKFVIVLLIGLACIQSICVSCNYKLAYVRTTFYSHGIVGYKLDRMGALWEFIIMCVCNVVITFFWHMKAHSSLGFLPTVL